LKKCAAKFLAFVGVYAFVYAFVGVITNKESCMLLVKTHRGASW
jgi:hypothetical protein